MRFFAIRNPSKRDEGLAPGAPDRKAPPPARPATPPPPAAAAAAARRPLRCAISAQDRGERHVLAAEDVALAHLPLPLGQEMPCCHVVDMDEIEAGIDEGRHAAGRGLDDHAPGRRRPAVARADRRRGIDDHRRQAVFLDHPPHRLLGEEFRALVGADHVGEAAWRGFVGRACRPPSDPASRRCWYRRCARRQLVGPPSSVPPCRRHWPHTWRRDRAPKAGNRPQHDRARRSPPRRLRATVGRSSCRFGSRLRTLRDCGGRWSAAAARARVRPAARSARTTAAPTKPDAPVTSTGRSVASMAGTDETSRAGVQTA